MRSRFFALSFIAALLFSVAGLAAGDTQNAKAKKHQSSRLLTLLPASDGIAVFDSKRFLDDALPRLLSANQPMLSEVLAKIAEMENRTGIDLRKFDQVAVGISFRQVSPTETDYEPVVIAGGNINAGALIAVAKLASNGTYREEKIGERTVFVFTPKEVIQKTTVKTTNSQINQAIDHALKGLSKEVAVTTLDQNTLAIGTLPRVRETLDAATHVGADLTSLLSVKETAVMSFASKVPGGMEKVIPLDNDAIGASINSIQYLSGSLDVAAVGTSLLIMARTSKSEQAAELKDMIEGLQIIGGIFFGNSKRPDQKIYARLIKKANITAHGNDVSLDILVPQTDIDLLVAGIK